MGENPLLYVFLFIVILFAIILAISVLTGLLVAFFAGRQVDKNTNRFQGQIRALLPDRDCGECGCESCDAYARAVLYGNASESACPYGSEEMPTQIVQQVNAFLSLMDDPTPPKPRKKGFFHKKL